jgi:hypothetical protein
MKPKYTITMYIMQTPFHKMFYSQNLGNLYLGLRQIQKLFLILLALKVKKTGSFYIVYTISVLNHPPLLTKYY